jgi:hypothetical protein
MRRRAGVAAEGTTEVIAAVQIVEDRLGGGGASDGVHVGIRVEGTPSGGTFTVWGTRLPETPEVDRLALTATSSGGGWWEVTLPTPGVWYLWLKDVGGWSPMWAVARLLNEQRLVGEHVRDLLRRHVPLFNAALRPHYNALSPSKSVSQPAKAPTVVKPEVAQVVYGLSELVEEYPAIVVHASIREEPYRATGYCRLVTVTLTVTCMLMHRDRLSSMLPAMNDLGQAVEHVLNLPEYNVLTLSNGIQFSLADAPKMESNEDAVPGMGWGAEATIQWSAQRLRQSAVLIPA